MLGRERLTGSSGVSTESVIPAAVPARDTPVVSGVGTTAAMEISMQDLLAACLLLAVMVLPGVVTICSASTKAEVGI